MFKMGGAILTAINHTYTNLKKSTEQAKHASKHAIFETTNIPFVQDSFVALRYLDWHVQRMQ